jgi:hypothetical protein
VSTPGGAIWRETRLYKPTHNSVSSIWWRATEERTTPKERYGILGKARAGTSRRWRSLRDPQMQQWRSNQRFKNLQRGERRERHPVLLGEKCETLSLLAALCEGDGVPPPGEHGAEGKQACGVLQAGSFQGQAAESRSSDVSSLARWSGTAETECGRLRILPVMRSFTGAFPHQANTVRKGSELATGKPATEAWFGANPPIYIERIVKRVVN